MLWRHYESLRPGIARELRLFAGAFSALGTLIFCVALALVVVILVWGSP